MFCFYWKVTLRTLFVSYSQTNIEEGIPSKRLVNIYDFCEQIRTFVYRSSSVSLSATVSSIFFFNKIAARANCFDAVSLRASILL